MYSHLRTRYSPRCRSFGSPRKRLLRECSSNVVASADLIRRARYPSPERCFAQRSPRRKGRTGVQSGRNISNAPAISESNASAHHYVSAHRQQEFWPGPAASVVAPLVPSRRSLADATIHEPDKGVARDPSTCDELRPGAARFRLLMKISPCWKVMTSVGPAICMKRRCSSLILRSEMRMTSTCGKLVRPVPFSRAQEGNARRANASSSARSRAILRWRLKTEICGNRAVFIFAPPDRARLAHDKALRVAALRSP